MPAQYSQHSMCMLLVTNGFPQPECGATWLTKLSCLYMCC